jgi:fructokinase
VQVAVLGEALIDFIADDSGAYHAHLGGSPFNVAIGLARQGMQTSYLASLSDDHFGDQLQQALSAEGVSLPLQRRSLWPTSIALVTLSSEGQPSYRLYREGIADKDTQYEEIIDSLPDGLRLFHTGSLAITPSQIPKIRAVFELLRGRGVLISIDINIRVRASIDRDKYINGVRSLFPFADIIKASDEDLAALGMGDTTRATADAVYREMAGGLLILTEGDGGAVAFSPAGEATHPSYRIAELVDTVGAGDTFHSALLAWLSRGGYLDGSVENIPLDALRDGLGYGCAAAAINVSRAGCAPPTHDQVTAFIAARDPSVTG